jgi:hypothetical protein
MPAEVRATLVHLLARITLSIDILVLTLKCGAIVGSQDSERGISSSETTIDIGIPMALRRRGIETKIVIAGPDGVQLPNPDPALIRAVARGHRWYDDLNSQRYHSMYALAQANGVSDRYIARHLPLAFLAPDIVSAILEGRQPIVLTAEALLKTIDLPLTWAEQRSVLGFA